MGTGVCVGHADADVVYSVFALYYTRACECSIINHRNSTRGGSKVTARDTIVEGKDFAFFLFFFCGTHAHTHKRSKTRYIRLIINQRWKGRIYTRIGPSVSLFSLRFGCTRGNNNIIGERAVFKNSRALRPGGGGGGRVRLLLRVRPTNPAFYGARTRPRARTDRDDTATPPLPRRYTQWGSVCAGTGCKRGGIRWRRALCTHTCTHKTQMLGSFFIFRLFHYFFLIFFNHPRRTYTPDVIPHAPSRQ